jgi:hypothetical protein
MTIGSLMTLVGIIIALVALAKPVQRQSIAMFVPVKRILAVVVCSVGAFLVVDGLEAAGIRCCPFVRFSARTVAVLMLIAAGIWGYTLWRKAELPRDGSSSFRRLLLSCLHEGTFEELIRILQANAGRLPDVLDKDTLDLLFERRSIRALVSARSWIHLDLLANRDLLKAFPQHFAITDRLVREYLAADESPLRTAALCHESGDETLGYSGEEHALIEKTFLDPDWYRDCCIGYPVLMAAVEALTSGRLDTAYNRNDLLYIANQGVSSRSRCPIFLAEKTIVNGLRHAIDRQIDGDFYATNLSDLLREVVERSRYDPAMWDHAPWRCLEFPTPFAYLMSAICLDLRFLSDDMLKRAESGRKKPTLHASMDIGRTWAMCVWHLAREMHCASESFRLGRMRDFMAFILEHLYCDDQDAERAASLAAWRDHYLGPLKHIITPSDTERFQFMIAAANRLDICKRYVFDWEERLREELGLPPRPAPKN